MKLTNLSTLSALILGMLTVGCQKETPDIDVVHKPPVVTISQPETVHFPADSVLLSGTATDSGSRIVSWLWSEVSGPNVPVIASEGSQSTKVHGLTLGQYVFQLTATDTFGLTGVNMVMVNVSGPDSVVLTLNSNSSEIGYLGPSPDESNSSTPELGAETWTINGTTVFVRSVFAFDLSSLPSTPVKSAHLSLYSNPSPQTGNLSTPNAGTANAFYIQRVSSSWSTSSISWGTQPTVDTTGEVLIPHTNASSLDLLNIDVTTLVNKMIATNNYGFEIRLQNEVIYNSRIFCSGNNADATKHPKLVISY